MLFMQSTAMRIGMGNKGDKHERIMAPSLNMSAVRRHILHSAWSDVPRRQAKRIALGGMRDESESEEGKGAKLTRYPSERVLKDVEEHSSGWGGICVAYTHSCIHVGKI